MPEKIVYVRFLQMQGDPRLRGDDEDRARMTMVGIGDARSDANEANDMQKLVFAYLSRRASHLCKPGMTAGGAGIKKARSMNGLVGKLFDA